MTSLFSKSQVEDVAPDSMGTVEVPVSSVVNGVRLERKLDRFSKHGVERHVVISTVILWVFEEEWFEESSARIYLVRPEGVLKQIGVHVSQ